MKKTIKILLLAVLVVCTVCVLTVMASAADADDGWEQVDQGSADDGNDLEWKLDGDTLTIRGTSTAIVWKGGATAGSSSQTMIPWVENNAANTTIKNVVIDAPITELPKAIFARHRNLKSVTLPDTCKKFQGSVFEGDWSLAEIKIGDESPANVINLSKITDVGSNAFKGAVTSGATLWMPDGNVYLRFNYGFGMSSATEYNFVVYPDSKAETDLKSWEGGSNVYGKFNISYYYQNSIVFKGWSVRTSDYNGLRGIFYADQEKIDACNKGGWELEEYGAFVTSAANKAKGTEVSYNLDTNTVTHEGDHLYRFAIDSTNVETKLGKKLEGSLEELVPDYVPENTYFAVTITKYTANYTTEVYMAGYEVWSNGVDHKIIYTDYGVGRGDTNNFIETSLYEVSLDMYMSGFLNAEEDDKNIVWKSLVADGALELEKEKDWTVDADVKDMDGKEFGDTFKVADVPMVDWKIDAESKTLTFEKTRVTYTVLKDFNSGKYVLVYRGGGEEGNYNIPATNPYGKTVNGESIGCGSQIYTGWFERIDLGEIERPKNWPNPLFVNEFYSNGDCATVIIDSNVAGFSNGAFRECGAISYMYHRDSSYVAPGAFTCARGMTTFYKAGELPKDEDNVAIPVVDLSGLTINNTQSLFDGCKKITQIHMPDGVKFGNSFGSNFAKNTKLDTLWCGDANNRIDGAINLSNVSGVSIGAEAFNATPTLTGIEIRLPEEHGTIADNAFSPQYESVSAENEVTKACWSGYCVM